MLFNVSQLLKEPTGFARAYTDDQVRPLNEAGHEVRIVGEVQMLRTDKGIWVEANLIGGMTCSCSLCLMEFDQPIEIHIQEEFLPQVDINTGARVNHAGEQDEDFYISRNHILDLTDAARQYFDINAPMRPVCTEQCKGICLVCGVNRNERECACQENQIDPRWSALVGLTAARTPDAN